MIFDVPIYENLSYEYVDFIYYYLLQKTYNGVVSHLHNRYYEEAQNAFEVFLEESMDGSKPSWGMRNSEVSEPITNMICDFYSLYFNFVTPDNSIDNWEKIFCYIELEIHYFYDIHKEYFGNF